VSSKVEIVTNRVIKNTTSQQDEQMKLAHDQGQSYAQIGKTFGISRMSVHRRLKGHIEAKKESETHCQNNQ